MVYSYQKITPLISRPIIRIVLRSGSNFVLYRVLIDSGADYCIFDIQIAEALGISLSQKAVGFRGVGKGKVKGFWGEIEIKIGYINYKTKAIFTDIGHFDHGILGQLGFFNHFDVKLSHSKQIIEIDPVKLPN